MDTQRRRQYLEAIGIDLWVPRAAAAALATVEPAPASAPAPAAAPASAAVPTPVAALAPDATAQWETLLREVRTCTGCPLHATRTQGVLGVSVTNSGLLLTPMMLGLIVSSVLTGQLIPRIKHYHYLGTIGLGLVIIYSFIYYRALGIVTIASLVISAGLVYACVVELGVIINFTLTLAGIAGFIVAVGIMTLAYLVLAFLVTAIKRDDLALVSKAAQLLPARAGSLGS